MSTTLFGSDGMDDVILEHSLMTLFDENNARHIVDHEVPTASAEEWTIHNSPWCIELLHRARREYEARGGSPCQFTDYEIAKRYVNRIRKSVKRHDDIRRAAAGGLV